MQHTILGAGGSIGNSLTEELVAKNESTRLVSRSGYSQGNAEVVKANLLSAPETKAGVMGSDVVYLCAGLKYSVKTWSEEWPRIMQNTIDACKAANAKLIFFDNVYMYGKVDGEMSETTPYNPCSKKGEIRARLATQLEEEFKAGNLRGCIARAADLYGPFAVKTSVPTILAIAKLMAGKKAHWLVSADTTHSYTYTTDCAQALYRLATTPEAMNQIWHIPTTNPGISGKTFINIVAREVGAPAKVSILKKWVVKLAGIFDATVGELYEMLYQNEYDYHFSSTKFIQAFDYRPTPYKTGLKQTVAWLKQNGLKR